MKRRLLMCLALWPLAIQAQAAPPWGLDRLMDGLKSVRSAAAHFVERRELAALNTPLQSAGTLAYVAPDQLQKVTLRPKPARLTVIGDRLTVEQEGAAPRNLSVSGSPELGAFVASIRATLAGDLASLQTFYTVVLDGDATDWTLRLVPRDARMRSMLSEVRIHGVGHALTRIETEEAGGDRSVMDITMDTAG